MGQLPGGVGGRRSTPDSQTASSKEAQKTQHVRLRGEKVNRRRAQGDGQREKDREGSRSSRFRPGSTWCSRIRKTLQHLPHMRASRTHLGAFQFTVNKGAAVCC